METIAQAIIAPNAPKAIGPYCHVFKYGTFVVTSGQLGLNATTGEFAGASVEDQTVACFANLKAVLEAAGSNMKNIIKITVYLKDMNDFAKVNAIYGTYFKDVFPARTCVEVSRLPKDALIEIEAMAFAI